MADFLGSLWESIFTAGPTPPLILATNAAFAALQAVLFALLLATHSVHFFALSAISAALWWAINWFVAELRVAAAAENDPATGPAGEGGGKGLGGTETRGSGDGEGKVGYGGGRMVDSQVIRDTDEDEDGATTETEAEELGSRGSLLDAGERKGNGHRASGSSALSGSGHLLARPSSSAAVSEASGVHVSGRSSSGDEVDLRRRGVELDGSNATDSEWERLSDVGSSRREEN